jgi:glycosyltransferase involved in cell wall biosynthesis
VRVFAVIPAYQESRSIGAVVARTLAVLGPDSVIVVDDGSTDGTAEAASSRGAHVLRLSPNVGKGAALGAGFREALARNAEAVVFLDADGQHDPASIPLFVRAACEGADLVLGTRMGAVGGMPWLRLWTNRTTSRIVSWLAGSRVTDSQCGFRLARARFLEGLSLDGARYDAESEMIVKAGRRGFTIAEVPVASIYGDETSSIRPLADTGRFLRMVWRSRRWH